MYISKKIVAILLLLILTIGICVHKDIDSFGKLCDKVASKVADYPAVDQFFLTRYPIVDKFWLHRTDTTEKLTTKGTRYKGVELDIVYYSNEDDFDNSHDEATTIEYPLGNMLAILGNNKQNIWFDYKNLTSENAQSSLNRLEQLLNNYGVDKQRCIVESMNYHDLKVFHDHGFYTSFYVPVNKKYLDDIESQKEFKSILIQATQSGNVDAVSFPITYYKLVKQTNLGKDLLLWDMGSKWWSFYLDPERSSILNDDAVKVILIKDYSKVER